MARKPLDLYATPSDVADAICARLVELYRRPGEVLEPSAGPGRFVAAARRAWPGVPVTAVDIDGAHRDACVAAGALPFIESDWQAYAARVAADGRDRSLRRPLLILGNPPYVRAQAHVEAALDLLRPGERMVFLLRHSFHGAEERVDFFERNPEAWSAVVLPRVSYVGDGGDMSDACVFCWEKGYRGPSIRALPILWGAAAAKRAVAAQQVELIGRTQA
jgi:SAM-dependent methyltransferase